MVLEKDALKKSGEKRQKNVKGHEKWGTKVLLVTKVLWGTKVHFGTQVRETQVLGTKVLFNWMDIERPGTKVFGTKVWRTKVLQPGFLMITMK